MPDRSYLLPSDPEIKKDEVFLRFSLEELEAAAKRTLNQLQKFDGIVAKLAHLGGELAFTHKKKVDDSIEDLPLRLKQQRTEITNYFDDVRIMLVGTYMRAKVLKCNSDTQPLMALNFVLNNLRKLSHEHVGARAG